MDHPLPNCLILQLRQSIPNGHHIFLVPNEILSFILSFIKYDINYMLVCKRWLKIYKETIRMYDVEIKCKASSTFVKGVHTLNMSFCDQIIDLKSLKGIHTLNINGCDRITNLKP